MYLARHWAKADSCGVARAVGGLAKRRPGKLL